MIISKHFAEHNPEKDRYYTPYTKGSRCPTCSHEIKVKSSKKRKCRLKDGRVVIFQLRKYRCEFCKASHTEHPKQIIRYKRHEAETIQEALDEEGNPDTAAEESTIRRWRVHYAELFARASIDIASLRAKDPRWIFSAVRHLFKYYSKPRPERV